ncbi:DUF4012 domain-containing protein [Methanobacterium spitsbergense]|uniref:DUF4012 domain-containing protein n=1 Tax=Methanobacterium spitsbergense TaxID=2874285 RepID=UPI001CBADD60|nr:DUF4012 domain-containing protein [Methanobacterium spitsbergense]
MIRKKLIVLIVILALISVSTGYVIYQYEQPASTNVMKGDHNVLVLLADTNEKRPGIGAVDMAYAIHVTDGDVKNITPIYPGGMVSSTLPEPAAAGGDKLKLNDALWNKDTAADAADAQSIVQENTGIKTDAVVILTPPAVDAVVATVGPINIPGYGTITNNSIDVIRNLTEKKNSTLTRGQATDLIMNPILEAAKNPTKAPSLFQTVTQQYLSGNIVIIPNDLMTQFAISKGLKLV